jgi:hypothetical protein
MGRSKKHKKPAAGRTVDTTPGVPAKPGLGSPEKGIGGSYKYACAGLYTNYVCCLSKLVKQKGYEWSTESEPCIPLTKHCACLMCCADRTLKRRGGNTVDIDVPATGFSAQARYFFFMVTTMHKGCERCMLLMIHNMYTTIKQDDIYNTDDDDSEIDFEEQERFVKANIQHEACCRTHMEFSEYLSKFVAKAQFMSHILKDPSMTCLRVFSYWEDELEFFVCNLVPTAASFDYYKKNPYAPVCICNSCMFGVAQDYLGSYAKPKTQDLIDIEKLIAAKRHLYTGTKKCTIKRGSNGENVPIIVQKVGSQAFFETLIETLAAEDHDHMIETVNNIISNKSCIPFVEVVYKDGVIECSGIKRGGKTSIPTLKKCELCDEGMKAASATVEFPCAMKHVFHAECCRDWINLYQGSLICPFCRK